MAHKIITEAHLQAVRSRLAPGEIPDVFKSVAAANAFLSIMQTESTIPVGFHYEQDVDPNDGLDPEEYVTVAGEWWADTTNKILYRRNAANDGWDQWTEPPAA